MNTTQYRKFVLLIVFIMYTAVFGVRISIGVTLPALISEFGMTNTEAGALSGFFFLGYVLTQVPAGFWIARFGSRILVGIALFLMSGFLWLFGTMSTLAWAGWYRFGLGISQGPVSVGGNAIISQWFPPREQSRAVSVMVAATMLAPVVFPPVAAWFIVEWGWRALFQAFTVMSLLIAIFWHCYIRSYPEQSLHCSPAELAEIRSPEILQPVLQRFELPRLIKKALFHNGSVPVACEKKILLKQPDLWWTTISYFCFVSVFYGIVTWLPSYFMQARGVSMLDMGWMSAVPWVGAFFGSLVGGWIVDHWLGGNPLPVMVWGGAFTAASLAIFVWIPVPMGGALALLLLIGFFVGFTPLGFMTYPIRLATREVYPVGMAVMNSGGNIGGFVAPLLSGLLLDVFQNYTVVFIYFIVSALLSSGLSLLVRQPVGET